MEQFFVTRMKTSEDVRRFASLNLKTRPLNVCWPLVTYCKKKNRVCRKRQLRTAYVENHILMQKSDNIIMFSWFSLILKLTRWNAFFNPPPNQTNSFRRKFRKENMIISNLPY